MRSSPFLRISVVYAHIARCEQQSAPEAVVEPAKDNLKVLKATRKEFIVTYYVNDGIMLHEKKIPCRDEALAKIHVARLKYQGYREAFYRAA